MYRAVEIIFIAATAANVIYSMFSMYRLFKPGRIILDDEKKPLFTSREEDSRMVPLILSMVLMGVFGITSIIVLDDLTYDCMRDNQLATVLWGTQLTILSANVFIAAILGIALLFLPTTSVWSNFGLCIMYCGTSYILGEASFLFFLRGTWTF